MPVISRKCKNSDRKKFAHVKLLQTGKIQGENNFFFCKGMNEWCTPFMVSEPVLDDASCFLSLILYCHGRFISDSWNITKILSPVHTACLFLG